jgi:hypothetical protein
MIAEGFKVSPDQFWRFPQIAVTSDQEILP